MEIGKLGFNFWAWALIKPLGEKLMKMAKTIVDMPFIINSNFNGI